MPMATKPVRPGSDLFRPYRTHHIYVQPDNEMTGASDSFATLTFTYTGDGQVQTARTETGDAISVRREPV